MSTLDYILLICFLPAVIRGVTKGFVEQAAGLASLILGIILGSHFCPTVSGLLEPAFTSLNPKVLNVLSFVLIVFAVALIMMMLSKFVTGIFKFASINWLNRLAGFVFAIFKTALILGLLVCMVEGLNSQFQLIKPEILDGSIVYQAIHNFALKIFPAIKEFITNTSAAVNV